MSKVGIELEIARIRRRLIDLDGERASLEGALADLERKALAGSDVRGALLFESASVFNGSPSPDKIALFRRLFAGRPDVFPIRWENPRAGRAGYSPACYNEWVRGVCAKPKVKCGECPHQAFIPTSDHYRKTSSRRRWAR